jgi:hypothetical protein
VTKVFEPRLALDALPGAYHYFIKAEYDGGTSYGWGIASKCGAPKFDAPVLADQVEYPQGAGVVSKLDYCKQICVAFGVDCPIIDLEMAYQVRNTLQAATGVEMRLCSVADIDAEYQTILVGTPTTNPLIAQASPQLVAGKGTILLQGSGTGARLMLTGETSELAQAAATDFVLRFWKNARDSAARISGLEEGAALGHKAAPGDVNLP